MDVFRMSLCQSAACIAAIKGEEPIKPHIAFIKALIQREWEDVGYYLAQSWTPLWLLYFELTPEKIIQRACVKFMGIELKKES